MPNCRDVKTRDGEAGIVFYCRVDTTEKLACDPFLLRKTVFVGKIRQQ